MNNQNSNKSGFQPSASDNTNSTFGIIGLGIMFCLLTLACTVIVYFQLGA